MNFSRIGRSLVGGLSTCVLLSSLMPFAGQAVYADTSSNGDSDQPNQFRSVEDNSYTAEAKTISQWTGHSNMEIVFTNTGDETIHDWNFTFDFGYAIENPYNCYIIEQKDNLYTIGNNEWNQDIKPGESVTIGFTASSSDESDIENMPSFYLLNTKTIELSEEDLSYSYSESSNWTYGFTGSILLTNNTDAMIRDWTINFISNKTITASDSSVLTSSDNAYTITNAGYSQNIPSGQSFSFGIQGGENDPSVALEITDFSASAKVLALTLDDDNNGNGVADVLETDFNTEIPTPTVTPEVTETPTEEPTVTPEVTEIPTDEPTPTVVADPYIKLKSVEDEYLTDVANQDLVFYAQSNISVSYIQVIDLNGNLICYLYDDGNFSSHYDDIGGDGIYSGKVMIDTSSKCTYEYQATANYNGETITSNTKNIYVYRFLTDKDWEDMDAVDNAIFYFLNTAEYKSLNHEEKIEAIIEFLTDISVNGVEGYEYSLIIPDSISYTDGYDTVDFLYSCEISGGVQIEDFDPEYAGVTPSVSPTPSTTATPTPTATSTPTPTPIPVVGNTNTNYSGDVVILYSYTNILDPNDARNVYDEYQGLADGILDDEGLDTVLIPNFTVDDLRTCFVNKELAVIGCHGGNYDTKPYFITNNNYTANSSQTTKDMNATRIKKISGSTGDYFRVYPSFFDKYYNEGQLLEGCVVMFGSCHSYGDTGNLKPDLLDAVVNCGAEAAIGYENEVYQLYPRYVFEEFVKGYISEGDTIATAYSNATSSASHMENDVSWYNDFYSASVSKTNPAVPHIRGNVSHEWTGTNSLKNGGFESYFLKWTTGGDARVITQLGSGDEAITPVEGERMAIITTGTGSGESAFLAGSNESFIQHTVRLLNLNTHLTFSYNMISEEVTEYVGSQFDDAFAVYAILYDGTKVELLRNSINTATWKDSASEQLTSINFPGGDNTTYQTGWNFCDIDLSDSGINPLTIDSIVFAVTDVGDSAFDTVVLIDDVEFD